MSLLQLSRLLPLPDDELQQVLEYASTLSKNEAVDHFKNLLGDSPAAVEFISTFNARRSEPGRVAAAAPSVASQGPSAASIVAGWNRQEEGSGRDSDGGSAVPRSARGNRKKAKAALHTLAPRQVASMGQAPGTTYNKKALEDDYISGCPGSSTPPIISPTPSKPLPAAVGSLISDVLLPGARTKAAKPHSNPISRTSTPAQVPSSSASPKPSAKTKVSITGGTPMHGAATGLDDFDAAIRALEISTNPILNGGQDDVGARRCNCVATRHPLQTAAPNCLNCGKVICLKEGLGPCTYCGTPLLTPADVQAMIKELRAERGRERMAADREAHRRNAGVQPSPRPGLNYARPRGEDDRRDFPDLSVAEAKAREHRDRLLGFQAQNARRTTVRDEAADFDVSGAMAAAGGGSSGNMWANPEERAKELKRQQKVLREMEWNARPEYEKRRQVVSIDLVRGKVVKKMAAAERPPSPDVNSDDQEAPVLGEIDANQGTGNGGGGGGGGGGGDGGRFSKNPLLAGVIRPVYDAKGKSAELEGRKDRKTRWRRVQDDLDNNEAVILDGGVYGGQAQGQAVPVGDELERG